MIVDLRLGFTHGFKMKKKSPRFKTILVKITRNYNQSPVETLIKYHHYRPAKSRIEKNTEFTKNQILEKPILDHVWTKLKKNEKKNSLAFEIMRLKH